QAATAQPRAPERHRAGRGPTRRRAPDALARGGPLLRARRLAVGWTDVGLRRDGRLDPRLGAERRSPPTRVAEGRGGDEPRRRRRPPLRLRPGRRRPARPPP